jgi:dolichol-phosphate mannosyltransferase
MKRAIPPTSPSYGAVLPLSSRDSQTRAVFLRYLKFCVVGGLGLLVDMAVLAFLASPRSLGWNPIVSKVIAAEIAMLSNFTFNETWTFHQFAAKDNSIGQRLLRLAKFNLICAAGIVISATLMMLQHRALGMNLYVANFFAIIAASVWNFAMNSRFGWKTEARL